MWKGCRDVGSGEVCGMMDAGARGRIKKEDRNNGLEMKVSGE